MAAIEVPQTLEYKGGQLNATLVLEVKNFTNWKKRFLCHIIGIEPQFENIISNGPYIPMAAGQRKPEGQWTADERKAANLDQRLKSLIMFVLPDDQINFVINCLTAKSTWDDLILYHEGPSDVKESRVMDLKLCYNTFKFQRRKTNHVKYSELASLFGKLKYEENLIDSIYETEKSKSLVSATPLSTAFFFSSIVQDFQDSPDDEEDTRSSYEYLNELDEEYQSDENEVTEVKALMALTDEEKVSVGKESARNGDWTKISMKKCINEQISTQKKKILGIDQLTEDTSSFGSKEPVFVKSSAENSDISITNSNIPKSSETEDSTLPNQDTDEVPSNESQRKTTNPLVVFSDSPATNYDLADESLVCSTPPPPLKRLDGVEPDQRLSNQF
ncbi:hypothetical protein Tco_0685837 [Tanacetum coccineum]